MENKENKIEKKGLFKKFIDDITHNVKEGASFVGEKVAETSAKAYVASSELVSETSEKIHDYTEKQSLQKEQNKIKERQKTIKQEFGILSFEEFLKEDNSLNSLKSNETILKLIDEYKANVQRMEAITLEIETLNNH